MDTQYSTGQVADMLGTSRSRVHRAVDKGAVRPRSTPGGHLRFTNNDVDLLRKELGVVPQVEGLTREEVLVLAALSRRPLGLISARAVARQTGISPTTASQALASLQRRRYVRRVRQPVVLGRATEVDTWRVNFRHRRWPELASQLGRVVLPRTPDDKRRRDRRVPQQLRHLFWNADLDKVDVQRDATYVAHRVLMSDDLQAFDWAARALQPQAWVAASRIRGVPPRKAALARNLAEAQE